MTHVFFVILPDVVLLDVACAAEAFRNAEQQRPGSYQLTFISPARSVRSGVGLELYKLAPLPKRLPPDALVVVTGVVGSKVRLDSAAVQQVVEWLPAIMAEQSVRLMCVCAGSVIAAKAGLLQGRECTKIGNPGTLPCHCTAGVSTRRPCTLDDSTARVDASDPRAAAACIHNSTSRI